MHRQGDILLVPVNDVLDTDKVDATLIENGRVILARGEVTGHHHSVAVCDVAATKVTAEAIYLSIMAPTTLDHQEHGSIALAPGTYRVTRQREYTPQAPRQVAD